MSQSNGKILNFDEHDDPPPSLTIQPSINDWNLQPSINDWNLQPLMSNNISTNCDNVLVKEENKLKTEYNHYDEDDEDEENEDELYRNFLTDQSASFVTNFPNDIVNSDLSSNCFVYPSPSSSLSSSITFDGNNGFLAKSFPPPYSARQSNQCCQVPILNDSVDCCADVVDWNTSSITSDRFTCCWTQCYSKFSNQAQLVVHIEYCHIDQQRYCQDNYICYWENCPRQCRPFNARYKLLNHMRIHSGEKPNKCPHPGCQKAFSRQENLKIHIRSHTGEKPYMCPIVHCRKAFSNSSDRAKHQRTHFNSKPYACQVFNCSKRYTDPSSLRKHMRTHSGQGAKLKGGNKLSASFHAGYNFSAKQSNNSDYGVEDMTKDRNMNEVQTSVSSSFESSFRDANNNYLSKSWCVNRSNSANWWNTDTSVNEWKRDLQSLGNSFDQQTTPSYAANTTTAAANISPYSGTQTPIGHVDASNEYNSCRMISLFRGFESCDEQTLRQQILPNNDSVEPPTMVNQINANICTGQGLTVIDSNLGAINPANINSNVSINVPQQNLLNHKTVNPIDNIKMEPMEQSCLHLDQHVTNSDNCCELDRFLNEILLQIST